MIWGGLRKRLRENKRMFFVIQLLLGLSIWGLMLYVLNITFPKDKEFNNISSELQEKKIGNIIIKRL